MDEQLIYEWRYPQLNGKRFFIHGITELCAVWSDGGKVHWIAVTPNDMNTWHGEVVPKLWSEGYEANFYGGSKPEWAITQDNRCYFNAAPYEALTEYLNARIARQHSMDRRVRE